MNIYDDDALFQDYIFTSKQIVQINLNQYIYLCASLRILKMPLYCLMPSLLIHQWYHC